MRRALVVLLIVGCGRIGFDPAGGIDITGDGPLPAGRWASVSVGPRATCAITAGDELWCFGEGSYGALGTGTKLIAQGPTRVGTGWSTVSVGAFHSCGVKTDASLWCWGLNEFGGIGVGPLGAGTSSPVQVVPGSGWASVSVGEAFSCALKTAGELWCWGRNDRGQVGDNTSLDQMAPVQIAGEWKAVSTGTAHACGIKSDKSLWCWGDGSGGQLGNDILVVKYGPVPIAAGTTWQAVSAADVHTCAIEAGTSAVWCWGENYTTMLGDGTYNRATLPKKTAMSASALATGRSTTCALQSDGTASCVGSATRADFGAAGDDDVKQWMKIAVTNLVAIAAGGQTTCAIDAEKHLFCVGANSYGQTGQPYGEVHDANAPTDDRRDWAQIIASRRHACATTKDGATWCWGDGYAGQNGDGTSHDRQVPKLVGGGWVTHALGEETTAAIKADGTVWSWGAQPDGDSALTPTQVGTATDSVAIGDRHGCRTTGTVLQCGGLNDRGQLGDGTTNASTSEITIAGQWSRVWAGYESTCATDPNGVLSCWGRGDSGQLGNGNLSDSSTPSSTNLAMVRHVGFGFGFACALRTDGRIYCWGDGADGQFGNGAPASSTTPVQVGSRTDWTELAVGDRHVCAIAANTAWCWGHGDEGQLGDPALTQRNEPYQLPGDAWVDVAAGDHFSCAVKANGARYCFGANEDGQLGNERTWQKTFLAVP